MEQTEAQRQATIQATGMQPVAQQTTPAAPTAIQPPQNIQSYQNPNAGFFNATPPPAQTTVNVNTGGEQKSQKTAQPSQETATQQGSLAMPTSGSVVDLLNMAGQSSDFASRKQLAQQFGMQGYAGTGAQNQELSKKFLDFFNQKKASSSPDSGAQFRQEYQQFQEGDTAKGQTSNPEASFFDAYSSMSPVVKSIYDTMNQLVSSTGTKQTLKEEYEALRKESGVEGLQTELLNVKKIMDGTDDDVRNEIAKAGGFATESQVQALTTARNKTLLKQASFLQGQIDLKNDYIDQVTKLSGLDRGFVEKELDRKLGLIEKTAGLQEKIDSAAKTNYQNIVNQVGYTGLSEALKGNAQMKQYAEKSLGLPTGSLSSPSWLAQANTFRQQQLAQGQQRINIDLSGMTGNMNPKQVAIFNDIVDKYNKSPLIAANDRSVILKDVTEALSKDPSNASLQVSFIYSMIQALDTYQSAVREGEIGLISATQGLGERIKNLPDKISKGSPLASTKVYEYIETARLLSTSITNAAKRKQDSFSKQAGISGVGDAFNEFVGGAGVGEGGAKPTSVKVGNQNVMVGAIITNSKGKRGRVNADGTITPIK